MKIMAIDLGNARTGVAVSDPTESFAFPNCVITEYNEERRIKKLADKALELSAELIVAGLPKNMDGSEGFRAEAVRAFAALLEEYTKIPYVFYDERLSTAEAHKILNITNTGGKKRKNVIDTLSAQIILQSYLDAKR